MVKGRVEESAEVIGGLCAAVLSSVCCWGPLVLAAFGVASGIVAPFAKYRWIFITFAIIFLGRALYLAYRTQNKRNIIIIWCFVLVALLFIFFPYLRLYVGM